MKEIDTTLTYFLLLIITIKQLQSNQPFIKVPYLIQGALSYLNENIGALSCLHWDPVCKTSHWQSQVTNFEYFHSYPFVDD